MIRLWLASAGLVLGMAACAVSPGEGVHEDVAVPESALAMAVAAPEGQLRTAHAFSTIADPKVRSAAIFMEMGAVLTHPRCVNCHPRTDRPLQGDLAVLHMPPVTRGPDDHGAVGMQCSTCHGPKHVAFPDGKGSVPGNPKWALAPIEMAWEGKSVGDICRQIRDRSRNGGKSLEEIHHHNAEDILVGYGWDPGPGRAKAPGTQREFGELTRAWIDTGAVCPL